MKPWKALVGALIAALTAVAGTQDLLPPWALLIVSAVLAGLTVFYTDNRWGETSSGGGTHAAGTD